MLTLTLQIINPSADTYREECVDCVDIDAAHAVASTYPGFLAEFGVNDADDNFTAIIIQ